VTIKPSQHGEGLFAASDKDAWQMVAPMGGVEVKRSWVEPWEGPGRTITDPYSYKLQDFGVPRFLAREDGNPNMKWKYLPMEGSVAPAYSAVYAHTGGMIDTFQAKSIWRRCFRIDTAILCCSVGDWWDFAEDAVAVLMRTSTNRRADRRHWYFKLAIGSNDVNEALAAVFNPAQFPVYADVDDLHEAVLDSSCKLRMAGSYVNDALEYKPVKGKSKGRGKGKAVRERQNCIIADVPILPFLMTGCLVATEDIKKGSELLTNYGPDYWKGGQVTVHKRAVGAAKKNVPTTSKPKNFTPDNTLQCVGLRPVIDGEVRDFGTTAASVRRSRARPSPPVSPPDLDFPPSSPEPEPAPTASLSEFPPGGFSTGARNPSRPSARAQATQQFRLGQAEVPGAFFEKRASRRERDVLAAVGGLTPRLPRLLSEKPGAGRSKMVTVRMTHKGVDLTAMGGRGALGGKRLVLSKKQQLKSDLGEALQALHDAGWQHMDLEPRNILWDGRNFNLVDFGLVRQTRNWRPDRATDKAVEGLVRWAEGA
jgi:hypothetical protein